MQSKDHNDALSIGLKSADMAVSIHSVAQILHDRGELCVNVTAERFGAGGEQVLVLQNPHLSKVIEWEAVGDHQYMWKSLPPHISECVATEILELLVNGGARESSSCYWDGSSVSVAMSETAAHLQVAGLIGSIEADGSKYQLSSLGAQHVSLTQQIGNPKRLMSMEEDKPLAFRSAYALLHHLTSHGWVAQEVDVKQEVAPLLLTDIGKAEHQVFYIRQDRLTLARPYLACLAYASQPQSIFTKDLVKAGFEALPHFASDKHYTLLLKRDFGQLNAMAMDDDAGVSGIQGPQTRGRHRSTQFRLAVSQRWGCVTIKGKKTRGTPALQCNCPRRSHQRGTRKCNWTMSYRSAADMEGVIHRLKYWIVEGMKPGCRTYADHRCIQQTAKDMPLSELPVLSVLESQKPPADRVGLIEPL
jgi:hypothetical protein